MTATVSVIIPTYNRASMLLEALESIFEQTYPVHEIIVVDDGSTDNTREVVENYRDRVSYIYQQNAGPASARNRGLSQATGDYITFLDSDDLYLPRKIEKQVQYLAEHPSVAMVYSSFKWVTLNGEHIQTIPAKLTGRVHHEMIWSKQLIATPSVMFRREILPTIGLFDVTLRILEDQDYWLRIAANYEIGAIEDVILQIRLHSADNLKRDPNKTLEVIEYLLRKNLQSYSPIFRRRVIAHHYYYLISEVMNSEQTNPWKQYAHALSIWCFHKLAPILLGRLLMRTFFPASMKNRLRDIYVKLRR